MYATYKYIINSGRAIWQKHNFNQLVFSFSEQAITLGESLSTKKNIWSRIKQKIQVTRVKGVIPCDICKMLNYSRK